MGYFDDDYHIAGIGRRVPRHPDCLKVRDRLTAAFRDLRKAGFIARQNFMCCCGCGWAALPKDTKSAVFYHRQDAEDLFQDGHVYLAWAGNPEAVVGILREHGLKVEWDGKEETRFLVSLPKALDKHGTPVLPSVS